MTTLHSPNYEGLATSVSIPDKLPVILTRKNNYMQ